MNAAVILERLARLALEPADFVVHASGSLVLRGILDQAGDIDIVARGAAWQQALELVEQGHGVIDKGTHDQRLSLDDGVEVYDGWLGESAQAVVSRAELVQGVPCAPLADVIAMKERLGRSKDRVHLQLIQAHERTPSGS